MTEDIKNTNNHLPKRVPSELHPRVADAMTKVSGCVRNLSLYGRFHPMFQDMSAAAHQSLSDLFAFQPVITMAVIDSYLTLDSFPLEDSSGAVATLADALQARRVGELRLSAGLTEEEITDFAELLCLSPEDLLLRGGIAEEMKKHRITHIETKGITVPAEMREGKDPADIYEEALNLIEEALQAIQAGLQIPLPEIRGVVEDSLKSLTADEGALLALAGIRSYDRYLSEHSVNVCILSMVLGRSLGMEPVSTVELGVASMLHDVGKVFIPDQIVKKPGKLSEEEWQQVRRHPTEGARALASIQGLPTVAPTIALEHHVYCDATGYPAFGQNHWPHLLSRLVAIVDTYDALTTDRPYRERWTGQQAIAWMLYEAPNRYDRQLMARFASRSNIYPIGALVQLTNDDLAVVVSGSLRHPDRPSIKLVNQSGKAKSAEVIDLADEAYSGIEIKTLAQPVEALLPYTDLLLAS